jgi:hypothetical protein
VGPWGVRDMAKAVIARGSSAVIDALVGPLVGDQLYETRTFRHAQSERRETLALSENRDANLLKWLASTSSGSAGRSDGRAGCCARPR